MTFLLQVVEKNEIKCLCSYLRNSPRTRCVFGLNAVVRPLDEVVGTLAHEIKLLAVKSGVVRVSDGGTARTALHLRALPLASNAGA